MGGASVKTLPLGFIYFFIFFRHRHREPERTTAKKEHQNSFVGWMWAVVEWFALVFLPVFHYLKAFLSAVLHAEESDPSTRSLRERFCV